MRTRSLRLIGFGSLALAALLAQPQTAFASETGYASATSTFVGIMAAPPIAVYAIADGYYGSKRSWSPSGWAWSEIAVGATMAAVGGALTSNAIGDSPIPGSAELAALYFTAGGLMMTHGALSVAFYKPLPAVSVSPTVGGLSVSLSGRF